MVKDYAAVVQLRVCSSMTAQHFYDTWQHGPAALLQQSPLRNGML